MPLFTSGSVLQRSVQGGSLGAQEDGGSGGAAGAGRPGSAGQPGTAETTPEERRGDDDQNHYDECGTAQCEDPLKRSRGGISHSGFGSGPQAGGQDAVGGDTPVGQAGRAGEVRGEGSHHGEEP